MPWPGTGRGPRWSRAEAGAAGAADPPGSWRQDTGRPRRNRSQGIRRPGSPRTRRIASPAMSSRTCAKPGCNTSATATLTYDYASRTAWVERLNDEAHPMRYDLCADHADALTGAAGLGAAGPPGALPGRSAPHRLLTSGAPPRAHVACPGDRGRHRAPCRRRPPSAPRWGLGDALGRLARRLARRRQLSGVAVIVAVTGHAGDDFDDLPLARGRARPARAWRSGFFVVPCVGHAAQGQRHRRRPRLAGPVVRPLARRARAGVAHPARSCCRCSTGRCSRLLDKTPDDLEGPAQLAHRPGRRRRSASCCSCSSSGVLAPDLRGDLLPGPGAAVVRSSAGCSPVRRHRHHRRCVFGATHLELLPAARASIARRRRLRHARLPRPAGSGPAIAAHVAFNMVTVVALLAALTRVGAAAGCDDGGRHGRPGPTRSTATCSSTSRVAGRRRRRSTTSADWEPLDARRTTASGPPDDPESARERASASSGAPSTGSSSSACVAVRLRQPAPAPDPVAARCPPAATWAPTCGGPPSSATTCSRTGGCRGWTPDWYAGFPAYQFYMVVPSLLIVALDVGLFGGWLDDRPARGGGGARLAGSAGRRLAALGAGRRGGRRRRARRRAARTAPPSSSSPSSACSPAGLRLRLRSPRRAAVPGAGAARRSASVLFLFDRNFTIYGGNIASTLAGEFAFSISLSFALALPRRRRSRGCAPGGTAPLAAVLLALTGLCHLIPAIFALVGHAS